MTTMRAIREDITALEVETIVNADNASLLGGGGVDGAVYHAAGSESLNESCAICRFATGDAKMTKGYKLPVRYVIYTVGPVWRVGTDGVGELLASCYRRCLDIITDLY